MRRGRPLTSQTAFGGQLPYKGSLVRPAARFDYNPFMYDGRFLRATSICHGTGYSQKSRLPKRTAVAGQPVVRVNHNPFEYNVDFYEPRTTSHEPRPFPRAEGHSRRCCYAESVAAQRHLSPRQPANGGLRGRQAPTAMNDERPTMNGFMPRRQASGFVKASMNWRAMLDR